MERIAEETLREILLRLPTRDVGRGRCVSWQWRRVLTNPSFVYLHSHAAHVVPAPGGTPAEALAVLEIRVRGIGLDMVVHNPTTAKAMGRITDLAPPYNPVNACNGYLLLAAPGGKYKDWPVFICNPVTGGTLKIPPPPNIDLIVKYALGFSPSCNQYKLFCLSYRWGAESPQSYLDVLTLDVTGGNKWRRHPRAFPNHAASDFFLPLTVLIDGKLYVVMEPRRQCHYRTPDRMLVIDVATEARRTLRLPVDSTTKAGVMLPTVHVQPFELCGELCIAVRVARQTKITFWVVPPKDHRDDGMRLHGWELRYTFHVNDDSDNTPSGAWFDAGDGMLCYRLDDILYKYKIKANEQQAVAGCFSEWDHRIQLPSTLAKLEFGWKKTEENRWNVYSGYRPSLLSPQVAFASFLPSTLQDFEHALVDALRSHQQPGNKRRSTDHSDNSSVKRIRGAT